MGFYHCSAASADTTVRLWRFDGAAAADAGPQYSAEEAARLQVPLHTASQATGVVSACDPPRSCDWCGRS